MTRFFIGDVSLPRIEGAPDVYRVGAELRERGISVNESEVNLLRKILWCLLQIQHDKEETEQHAALAMLAALVLGIFEDDDFFVPADVQAETAHGLEVLAIEIMNDRNQQNMQLGVAIGMWDLTITSSADLARIEAGLPMLTDELKSVLTKLGVHLRQGEGIYAQHSDPQRQAAHRARLTHAYERATHLLGRLVAVGESADYPNLRASLKTRELRRIEIDALGAQRVRQDEQAEKARELMAWTEEDLGEKLTDENKAQLADRLRAVALEESEASGSGLDWFFDTE